MEELEANMDQVNSTVPIPWLDADTFYSIYKDIGCSASGLSQKMRDWIVAYEKAKLAKT